MTARPWKGRGPKGRAVTPLHCGFSILYILFLLFFYFFNFLFRYRKWKTEKSNLIWCVIFRGRTKIDFGAKNEEGRQRSSFWLFFKSETVILHRFSCRIRFWSQKCDFRGEKSIFDPWAGWAFIFGPKSTGRTKIDWKDQNRLLNSNFLFYLKEHWKEKQ